MVGISGLNTNNPMVTIMETEFESVRRLLMEYTKLHVRSLICLNICNVIICLSVFCNIPYLIVTEIILNRYLINMLKEIHKECNLKQIGKILFDESPYNIYDINTSDVYNTTRQLSTMKGKVSQSVNILKSFNKYYIISASICLGWVIIMFIIKLIWR